MGDSERLHLEGGTEREHLEGLRRDAREQLGWRWHVQQALWAAISESEITTWTDACGLTELVAATLEEQGYEVVATMNQEVDF